MINTGDNSMNALSKKIHLSLQALLLGMVGLMAHAADDTSIHFTSTLRTCEEANKRPTEEYTGKRYDVRSECAALIQSIQENQGKPVVETYQKNERVVSLDGLSILEDAVSGFEKLEKEQRDNNFEVGVVTAEKSVLFYRDLLRKAEDRVKENGFSDLVKPETAEYAKRTEELQKESDSARDARIEKLWQTNLEDFQRAAVDYVVLTFTASIVGTTIMENILRRS
jgi:hypothetical protein